MANAVTLVSTFRQLRVLVIGDAMLDTYLEGSAARLCSEGPVPVVRKTSETHLPGGAANTAANLRALEAQVCYLGIVGDDHGGQVLRETLRSLDIDDRWLVRDPQATTLRKIRILADGQYVVRFDEGTSDYTSRTHERLVRNLEEAFAQCDLVVISDYRYGVVTDKLLARLNELRRVEPRILLVDSKNLHRFTGETATVVTPNLLEARLLVGDRSDEMPDNTDHQSWLSYLKRLGEQVLALISTEHVAITLADKGVFLLARQGKAVHLPAHPVPQANDVGAGDSFASAMALALAAGGSMDEAAQVGIDAAAIAISKRRTSVVHLQELLQRVSLRDHGAEVDRRFPLERAEAQRALARVVAELEIERQAGRKIVFTNGVFDILHAGHVQFLRQARALGDLLVVGINRDRSAQRLKGQSRPINSERDRLALVAALEPVDYVVLFDEDTPTSLIRTLRPDIHVKGGDYANEVLPEAEAVQEIGGQLVILPLAGTLSTSGVIDKILSLVGDEQVVDSAERGESRDR